MSKNHPLKHIWIYVFALTISVCGCISCKEQITKPLSSHNVEQPFQQDIQGIHTNTLSKKIRSMLQDNQGYFWFGSDGEGVYRYDGKSYIQFTYEHGLGDNQIRNIGQDPSGAIWVGTGMGVSRFDGHAFHQANEETPFALPSSKTAVWKSAPGDLWFEASDKEEGVYRYDGKKLSHLLLPQSPLDAGYKRGESNLISAYGVYTILKDSKGAVWFGTQTLGVCCFTGTSFFWLTEEGLSGPAVRALFEDSKGNLWLGNNGNGLFVYDGKSLKNLTEQFGLVNEGFKRGQNLNDNPGTLARVWSINEDTGGDIWIGTIDAGIWRYNGKSFINYTMKNGLTSNVITLIFKDRNGELWIGSEGGGVMRFNGTSFYAI